MRLPLTGKGLDHLAYRILSYLDAKSLCRAELVCNEWYHVVADGYLWKKLIARKVSTDSVWKGLSERRGWGSYLFRHVAPSEGITHSYYRQLYPNIIKDIEVRYRGVWRIQSQMPLFNLAGMWDY